MRPRETLIKCLPFAQLVGLLVALCVDSTLSQPARAAAEHDLQLWTPIMLDRPICKKVHGYFEVVPRIGDGVTNEHRPWQQVLMNKKIKGCLLINYST
ncbi:hypothetical protein BH11CYA1_BH11CYA1_19610 [soil metagenome]